jgi:hypothetical protein
MHIILNFLIFFFFKQKECRWKDLQHPKYINQKKKIVQKLGGHKPDPVQPRSRQSKRELTNNPTTTKVV